MAGVSTRAAAESAARAGFDVTAIDAFADIDQHPSVRASCVRPFSPDAAVRAARAVGCDAAVYLSNFENHPEAVRELSAGRQLWGNAPDVLRRVRDPVGLAQTLRDGGISTPRVVRPKAATFAERPHTLPQPAAAIGAGRAIDARTWLIKPLASGGGHGVAVWNRDAPVRDGCCLQEFVEGWPGSMVFVAANRSVVPLGVCRQLIGDGAFGATGYRYCGSILIAGTGGDDLIAAAGTAARAVVEAFDLVGLNGLDFIARDGLPHIVEVNPRWTASVELVERAYGLPAFSAHAGACLRRELPSFDLNQVRRGAVHGKAVVFAREDVRVGDTTGWPVDDMVRDVPHPGDEIRAGRPICTVFATGNSDAGCYAALVRRAEIVYAELAASASVPGSGMRENR